MKSACFFDEIFNVKLVLIAAEFIINSTKKKKINICANAVCVNKVPQEL